MPTSDPKSLLLTATEKPSHYRYLKEFRVEQCPLFPQHKCTQHRPYSCFNWHFPNQRRRRPVRKRDGLFNYSPDTYCTKYDEAAGSCPDGDDCPYLHRTAGDTERRYHLKYFKTCMCVYETDQRGFCVKNGAHCAFAHGEHDKRPPVYDIRELQTQEQEQDLCNGPNQLDKEMMIHDPKWLDANYVLLYYKTEACKRPPRLCRQGFSCPHYHNLRDRRRSPKKHKYRSTPCPNVKHGDEWGEPALCDDGDNCPYCHTRTEQQFHPEIYKSSKCNDILSTTQVCPRGPFCAFAHADQEMSIDRNLPTDTNFADILSNVLPSTGNSSNNGSNNLPMDMNIMMRPVGSKPGETNNNINNNSSSLMSTANGNGTSNSIMSNNNSAITNSSNGVMDGLGMFSLAQGMDLTDVLRHPNSSPLDHSMLSNGGNGYFSGTNASTVGSCSTAAGLNTNGGYIGTQSFASAVGGSTGTDRSNSANSSASHGGKFFDDQPKNMGSDGLKGSSFYENFDNILSFGVNGEDQRDAYSLFPTGFSLKSGVREDLSRGDSPSTVDKDLDCSDHYSPGGIAGTSKPVSIPPSSSASSTGGFFSRDRFPSGSTSSLSNSFGMHPVFPSSDPTIDQKSDLISNQFSNMFDYGNRVTVSSSTVPTTVGNMSNGFGNGPGPIGSSAVLNNGNNCNGAYNNGNGLGSLFSRSDLCYHNGEKLSVHLKQLKSWIDSLIKANNSYSNRDSPNFSCLACKSKDRPRTIVVLPCDHQVLCSTCGPSARDCPLCGSRVLSRKQAQIPTAIEQ